VEFRGTTSTPFLTSCDLGCIWGTFAILLPISLVTGFVLDFQKQCGSLTNQTIKMCSVGSLIVRPSVGGEECVRLTAQGHVAGRLQPWSGLGLNSQCHQRPA
jgi:hypothetical protein